MKRFFIIGVAALLLLALAGIAPQKASADTNCALSASDFSSLQAIQNDPTLTPNQELSQELALRKQLLTQTISCAIGETQTIQAQLNAISTNDQISADIQTHLSGKMDDSINFYNLESAKLNNAGISATEAIAREMISWRAANYVPVVGDINDFILWSQNQTLFNTAQDRMTKTDHIVSFIESAAPDTDLQSTLTDAQNSLRDAGTGNTAAESALSQLLPSDQILPLIQQSLKSLADTYQHFSDLNVLIQKLLPTNQ